MIRMPLLKEPIQRCIDCIKEGRDFGGKAESAIRRLCFEVLNERSRTDFSWLDIAQELICERLSKISLEGEQKDKDTAIGMLVEIDACRVSGLPIYDNDTRREIFLRFVQTCNAYNISFLAAGFGDWQESYRAKESGNLLAAAEQIFSMDI
jgi:hypothetical protein